MSEAAADQRLAQRAVGGDERAFAAIFRRYHQRLYRFCLAIVGNPEDAQDALQNTMVKVLRALPGEERRIELKPWLYRIAHNESIEMLRRRRETRELDADLPAPGPGLAEEAGTRERLRRLLADLDELPERQRETLVMRELGGLEFAEIGIVLETTAAVARQTVYEARLSLRQMDEGREMSCDKVTRALSDGDGRVVRRRDVRAHLRSCDDCRRFREEIDGRRKDLAALSPLPAVAAAGLLQGLLGSAGGSAGGGGLAAALGGGAAKTAGASLALKGAASVAVVAAIGVGAADRGGLIDAGLPGGGSSPATETREAGGGPGAAGGGAAPVLDSGVVAGPRSAKAAGRGASEDAQKAPGAGAPGAATGGNAEGGSDAGAQGASNGNGNAASHPHGRGHEKAHPAASAHGQQTAAAHKGSNNGSKGSKGSKGASSGNGGGHAAQPGKPSHPSHPANAGAGKGASANAPKGGAKGQAAGGGAQAAPVAPLPEASGQGQAKGQEKP